MFELPALGLARFHVGISIVVLVCIGSLMLMDLAKVVSILIFEVGIVWAVFLRVVVVFQTTHVLSLV